MKGEPPREFPKRPRDTEPMKGEIKIRWRVEGRVLKSEIATHMGDNEAEIFLALAAALKQLGHDAGIEDAALGRWFAAYLEQDQKALKLLLEPVESKA